MKKESRKEVAVVLEKETGMLYYDRDDGYCLDSEIPGDGCRIKDLFNGHEHKKIRVTIKVLDEKDNQGSKG